MPALPPSSDFTGSAVTEGQFKTAISNLRTFLSDLLGSAGTVSAAQAALGTLAGQTIAKTAAYTVVTADRGKVILCSGTFTLSLSAASTLANGFSFIVVNTGNGVITIDPNSTEQIDGASTKLIGAGSSAIITCNGSAFYSVGGGGGSGGQNAQVFASSGSWVVPAGVSNIVVTVVGGGGGGRYGTTPRYGGSGGFAMAYCTNVSGTLTITVGAGGNGGNNTNGTSGGTSSVTGTGVSVSATGGSGATTSDGVDGNGTVSTGTLLKTTSSYYMVTDILSGLQNNSNTGQAWSNTGFFRAGVYGNSATGSSGGIGGAVIIQW